MRSLAYIAILFVLLIFTDQSHAQFATQLPSKGLRDTALMMLQEFVTTGGDLKLGFDASTVKQARIDTLTPVTFYFAGQDSSWHTVGSQAMCILVHVNKVVYPVLVGNRICGSISFGCGTNNWHVREFQDSSEILRYMNTMAILKPVTVGNQHLMAAYIPGIDETVILQGDSAHIVVTSTSISDPAKKKRLSQPSLQFLRKPQIPYEEFIRHYRKHIALLSQSK